MRTQLNWNELSLVSAFRFYFLITRRTTRKEFLIVNAATTPQKRLELTFCLLVLHLSHLKYLIILVIATIAVIHRETTNRLRSNIAPRRLMLKAARTHHITFFLFMPTAPHNKTKQALARVTTMRRQQPIVFIYQFLFNFFLFVPCFSPLAGHSSAYCICCYLFIVGVSFFFF